MTIQSAKVKTRVKTSTMALAAIAHLFPLMLGAAATAGEFDQALADLLPQSIKDAGVVTIVSPQNVPPNIFVEGSELKGEAVDLIRAIEPVLGVKFEFIDLQWPGVIPGIQAGNYDMSIGVMSYKPEREEILDMIVYRSNVSGILARSEVADAIQVPSDLCGRVVAAVQGSVLLQQLETESAACVAGGKTAITIMNYPTTSLAMVALKSGSVEAYPASTGELAYAAQSSNGELVVRHFDEWQGNPQAAAVSKDEPGLADAIAGALQQLHDNGEYLEILKKYNLESSAIAKDEIVVNPAAKN